MKLLYCGLKYDYGDKNKGFSFEHVNFYNSLKMMKEIKTIDYLEVDQIINEFGKDYLNENIINLSKLNKYDLIFFFLFKDEFYKNTLDYLKKDLSIPTVAWMADDHWRFENYSKFWANHFTLVVTTDKNSIPKYQKNNIKNVHLSQWACNQNLYKPTSSNISYNTTFVGMSYGSRNENIEKLNLNEKLVECWGEGWKNGRITLEKMNEIYSNSIISLNFSKSSYQKNFKTFVKIFISKNSHNNYYLNNGNIIIANLKNFIKKTQKQIKGRIFEVTGCRGFLLSENCENIEDYFDINKEIVIFENLSEARDKIKFYLKNEKIAKEIAYKGYQRVLNEHTYEKRFIKIFKLITNVPQH